GEGDEEDQTRRRRVRGPAALAQRAEPSRKHEACGDEREECDRRDDEVQQAERADRRRRSRRRPRRESVHRIGAEDGRGDEPETVARDEQRAPGRGTAGTQDLPHPDRARDDEKAADEEVRDLDPAEVAVAEHAERVARDVEALAREGLAEPHHHEDQTGEGSAGEQCPHGGHGVAVGCENRMWLPNGSRSAQSMPYGRSVGSSVNSTPFARSSSYVLRQSSVVKNRCPPARPFVTRFRTCAAVLSSMIGWPGRSSRMAWPSSPGTATVSQRMNPRSWSSLTFRPSLPT